MKGYSKQKDTWKPVRNAFNHESQQMADCVSNNIIGAAIEVHRELGPGLLESTYEQCLAHELKLRDIKVQRQVDLPVEYKGIKAECGYRLDMIVEDMVLVELKAVDAIAPIHKAQVMKYLRHSRLWLGLLSNFNVPLLKDGITRLVCG